jgi:hypothetical protein
LIFCCRHFVETFDPSFNILAKVLTIEVFLVDITKNVEAQEGVRDEKIVKLIDRIPKFRQ